MQKFCIFLFEKMPIFKFKKSEKIPNFWKYYHILMPMKIEGGSMLYFTIKLELHWKFIFRNYRIHVSIFAELYFTNMSDIVCLLSLKLWNIAFAVLVWLQKRWNQTKYVWNNLHNKIMKFQFVSMLFICYSMYGKGT